MASVLLSVVLPSEPKKKKEKKPTQPLSFVFHTGYSKSTFTQVVLLSVVPSRQYEKYLFTASIVGVPH